ncbi:glycosyltransferase family A protein [Yoonia sp. I 8.24]|uniref:glycosyltransferase family 2 protein n=1 Tax=Yoonia sp. I 8.24 TaxID=1537229 RepID=UPI001EDDF7F8|nr:glycosyltransferase family A protein [Yoonia sp. I 8.24]MCG3267386.1 glycosyltransferase family 2 protein [Yoonia sp. I 8.24]
MTITVIIPVFNRAEHIRPAIESVLRQDATLPLDVLVVDDGSTDDTPQILSDLAAEDPRVRIVRRENGGVTRARNTGLENLLPETAFVTFLDSDDIMAPDRFTTDLQILLDEPDVAITYGDMLITFEIDRDTFSVPTDAKQIVLTSIHLACCLYRRPLIEKIGKFDEGLEMAEDTDFIFRTFEIGVNFRQTPTICHFYLRHEGNMSSSSKDNVLWFNRALVRSVVRRRREPWRRLVKPEFNVELPRDFWAQ